MRVGYPAENDKDRVKYLWKYCFGDSDAFIEYFFTNYYKKENTLAIFDDDKIVSYLMIFPNELSIGGNVKKAAYVAGVCTDPLYRGKGCINILMRSLDERLLKEGYEAAFLIPFNFAFYRKYGFECISFLSIFEGEITTLPSFGSKNGKFQGKEEVYARFCKNKDVYLVRNRQSEDMFLRDSLAEGGYHFEDEDVFMYYYLENDTFFARELVYASVEGAKKALSFIKAHSAQVSKFKIRSDFGLSKLLCEKNININVKPHVVAKFYDKSKHAQNVENYINMIGWV